MPHKKKQQLRNYGRKVTPEDLGAGFSSPLKEGQALGVPQGLRDVLKGNVDIQMIKPGIRKPRNHPI